MAHLGGGSCVSVEAIVEWVKLFRHGHILAWPKNQYQFLSLLSKVFWLSISSYSYRFLCSNSSRTRTTLGFREISPLLSKGNQSKGSRRSENVAEAVRAKHRILSGGSAVPKQRRGMWCAWRQRVKGLQASKHEVG